MGVTRLVLRFTNNMLRALLVTPFLPCDALEISRYKSEGEKCICSLYVYVFLLYFLEKTHKPDLGTRIL